VGDADGGDIAFDLEPFVIGCVFDRHNVLLKLEKRVCGKGLNHRN
jgi:hypothetical protein